MTRSDKDLAGEPPSADPTEPSSLDTTPAEPLVPGPGDIIQGGSLEGRRAFKTLRVTDSSMSPIVAEGAQIAYAEPEPISEQLDEKLVVAWIDGVACVRWFQHCGRFALLRAENPTAIPPTILIEVERPEKSILLHRVLWISTPH
jgi:hypothetical protein